MSADDDDKTPTRTIVKISALRKHVAELYDNARDRGQVNEMLVVQHLVVALRQNNDNSDLIGGVSAAVDLIRHDLRTNQLSHAHAYEALVDQFESFTRDQAQRQVDLFARQDAFEEHLLGLVTKLQKDVADVSETSRHLASSLDGMIE